MQEKVRTRCRGERVLGWCWVGSEIETGEVQRQGVQPAKTQELFEHGTTPKRDGEGSLCEAENPSVSHYQYIYVTPQELTPPMSSWELP